MRKSLVALASVAALGVAIPTVAQAQSSLGSLGEVSPTPSTSTTAPSPTTTTTTQPPPDPATWVPIPGVTVFEQHCALVVEVVITEDRLGRAFTDEDGIVLVEPVETDRQWADVPGYPFDRWVKSIGIATLDYRQLASGTIGVWAVDSEPVPGEQANGFVVDHIRVNLPTDGRCSVAPRRIPASIDSVP